MRLSLVDLTGGFEQPSAAPARGTASPGPQPPPQGPPGFAEPSSVPPPPMQSPKLPPGMLLPGLEPADGSPVVACVANARAPLFAPPAGPAPEPASSPTPADFNVPPSKAPGTC
mmetsp:Transcript_99796/g.298089  ORF Transcript_99796/g.298089 Transcript_99796/m.298089 type:complete len:114 (-) Transcript_99796:61-402(-)